MMLAAEWGTGEVLWSMMWFFLFVIWIWLIIVVFGDIIRSQDMGGGAKAFWVIFIILVPYLGIFVYLIARGGGMAERAERSRAGERGDAGVHPRCRRCQLRRRRARPTRRPAQLGQAATPSTPPPRPRSSADPSVPRLVTHGVRDHENSEQRRRPVRQLYVGVAAFVVLGVTTMTAVAAAAPVDTQPATVPTDTTVPPASDAPTVTTPPRSTVLFEPGPGPAPDHSEDTGFTDTGFDDDNTDVSRWWWIAGIVVAVVAVIGLVVALRRR